MVIRFYEKFFKAISYRKVIKFVRLSIENVLKIHIIVILHIKIWKPIISLFTNNIQ